MAEVRGSVQATGRGESVQLSEDRVKLVATTESRKTSASMRMMKGGEVTLWVTRDGIEVFRLTVPPEASSTAPPRGD